MWLRPAIAAVTAAVAVTAMAAPTPAAAYDTGPHAELTEAALAEEGFDVPAQSVAQVNNWFPDPYEQAKRIPGSGHLDVWAEVLAVYYGLIPPAARWPDAAVDAANASHFDSTTKTLSSTAGWRRSGSGCSARCGPSPAARGTPTTRCCC